MRKFWKILEADWGKETKANQEIFTQEKAPERQLATMLSHISKCYEHRQNSFPITRDANFLHSKEWGDWESSKKLDLFVHPTASAIGAGEHAWAFGNLAFNSKLHRFNIIKALQNIIWDETSAMWWCFEMKILSQIHWKSADVMITGVCGEK